MVVSLLKVWFKIHFNSWQGINCKALHCANSLWDKGFLSYRHLIARLFVACSHDQKRSIGFRDSLMTAGSNEHLQE